MCYCSGYENNANKKIFAKLVVYLIFKKKKGMPFANIKSLELQEKMQYLNKNQVKKK